MEHPIPKAMVRLQPPGFSWSAGMGLLLTDTSCLKSKTTIAITKPTRKAVPKAMSDCRVGEI